MKNKYLYVIGITLIVILLMISLITFNGKFRDLFLSNINNVYKVYSNFKTKKHLKISNFKELSNAISDQINMSLRLSDKKTSLHENIFYNLNLAFKKIVFEEELLYFEKPVKKILEIDPDIYMANVWMAEIINANNNKNLSQIDEALLYINKAIKLAPARPEAYKVGLKIVIKNNLKNEKKNLCNKYNNLEGGGSLSVDHYNFFRSNNIKNMVLSFPDQHLTTKIYENGFSTKASNVYENHNIELNKTIDYEFNFLEKKNFNNFSLILGTLPGISIEIKQILLISENQNKIINPQDIYLLPKNGFVSDSIENFILTNKGDENISFIFKEEAKNIESIIIKMEFKKLKIINFCN